jgi:hypothetical protein
MRRHEAVALEGAQHLLDQRFRISRTGLSAGVYFDRICGLIHADSYYTLLHRAGMEARRCCLRGLPLIKAAWPRRSRRLRKNNFRSLPFSLISHRKKDHYAGAESENRRRRPKADFFAPD